MADGTITVTIDTNEWKYPDASGVTHTVTNGQTFTLASTDTGTGGIYKPTPGGSVSCTDGSRLEFIADNLHSYVTAAGDTAVTNDNNSLGDWLIRCTADGKITRWKCSGLDVDDADSVDEFTSARFEAVDDPTRVFTWTSVTAVFA